MAKNNLEESTMQHLENATNGQLPSPADDQEPPHSLHEYTLPQIIRLYPLDSSELFPSQPTSIYDAEPVLTGSDKNESLKVIDSHDAENPKLLASYVTPRSCLENTPLALRLDLSQTAASSQADNRYLSRPSKWPDTRSTSNLKHLSHGDLKISYARSQAISAYHQLHAKEATAASPQSATSHSTSRAQRLLDICHRRSFSLNDLECLRLHKVHPLCVHDSSSSSGEALRVACLCDTYPIKPKEPPPLRVPTPPGLPTFGTKEAMEFRMPAAGRPSWLSSWRTSKIIPDIPRLSVDSSGPASAGAVGATPPTLTDGLKRLLGFTHIVSPIPEEPRRAPLPTYLARADDGTLVRGRFGARHSAHGIVRGQLDNHPFHDTGRQPSGTRLTSLDRAVQDIEKACAEAEHETTSTSRQAHSEGVSRSGERSPRMAGQHTLTIAEVLCQQPLPSAPVNVGSALNPVDQAMRSQPSPILNTIGSETSVQSQDAAGIHGMRQFVEDGERIALEQNQELTEKKKQRSTCENCWFAFCVSCCDMDNPDRDIVDASRVMLPERGTSSVHSPEIRPLRIVHEQPHRQRMTYL